jgi:hypothetical protein
LPYTKCGSAELYIVLYDASSSRNSISRLFFWSI